MSQGQALAVDGLNVVIVGGGTIARSLVAKLCERANLSRLLMLSRSPQDPIDPRVQEIAIAIDDPATLADAAQALDSEPLHCLINTIGVLHGPDIQPEKRLKQISIEQMQRSFMTNAMLLPLLAQAFSKSLKHKEPAIIASLSARVGSIEDNQLGGWYSYRASKAAHNMFLKTLSLEWRVSHKNVCVVALHPGTVRSQLSEPFITDRYNKRVLSGKECADALLGVLGDLSAENTGGFYDWQGLPIAW
ncbi:MAG: SDR family NAD(P)-dependent oxidoreductase [Pseudomonadota bacterium]